MSQRILVITGRYHLGDNPGVFQDAHYVGHALSFPLRLRWINDEAHRVGFVFTTHDVETWGAWRGHKVSINGREVGRLKDPSDVFGKQEEFVIDIPRADFEALLAGNKNFALAVDLDKQPPHPGLADDFVLMRIDALELAAAVGWE